MQIRKRACEIQKGKQFFFVLFLREEASVVWFSRVTFCSGECLSWLKCVRAYKNEMKFRKTAEIVHDRMHRIDNEKKRTLRMFLSRL